MSYPSNSDSVAQDQLRAFVERIERLEEERKSIARDIAEVYAEAKGTGFDRAALKAVVRIRAQDPNDRLEHEAIVALYLNALGMTTDEPSHVHVHTREEPDHDPDTGEIIEPSGNGAGGAEEGVAVANDAAQSSAQPTPDVGSDADEQASGTGETLDAGLTPLATVAAPHPTGANDDRGGIAPPPSVTASVVTNLRSHNPETHFLNSEGLVRLNGCLKPEVCGSSQPRVKLCFGCSVQHDGPAHGDAA